MFKSSFFSYKVSTFLKTFLSHLSSESKKFIYFPEACFSPLFLAFDTPLFFCFIYLILFLNNDSYFKQIFSELSVDPSFTSIISIFFLKPMVCPITLFIVSSK